MFGPANNEPTFRLHQKNDKKSRKNLKNIIGSELSETNNEPTFRIFDTNENNNF